MTFPLLALSRPQELHLGDGGPEESKRGREGWDGMGSEGNIRVRSTIMSHPPPLSYAQEEWFYRALP